VNRIFLRSYLVYGAPLVAALVLIAFMVKPLFAKPGGAGRRRVLDPSKHALLHAFADGVCSSIGSPAPSRIEVSWEVNASAHVEGGALSLFRRDLVLTVGLPLLIGRDLRQFAGVLAHEFGHFSQGAGMRVQGLIWSINSWFARVVYERDEWDETLAAYASEENLYSIVLAQLTRLLVWLTRRVLWVLMVVGHALSCFLLRQMEFDADRYEARMVGSDTFEATTRRLRLLAVASQGAFADISHTSREGRYPDDWSKLVLVNVGQIPAPQIAELEQGIQEGKTGLFDSHPCARARIARAHREKTDGIFHLEGPATDLIPDFSTLSKTVTLAFYRATFGKGFSKDNLKPVADVVRVQEVLSEGNQAIGRFYLGAFSPLRPMPFPASAPSRPTDPKAVRRALEQARESLSCAAEDYPALLARLAKIDERFVQLQVASTFLKTDFPIQASKFGLSAASAGAVVSAERDANIDWERVTGAASGFEQGIARRMHSALSLIEDDRVVKRIPDGARWQSEARSLYPAAALIGARVIPALTTLLRSQQTLYGIFERWKGNEKNERFHNAIRRGARKLHEHLHELKWKVGDAVSYPFDHAQGEISTGRFVFPPVMPEAADIDGLLHTTQEVSDKIVSLHCRLLGRLVLAAEEVERVLGLSELSTTSSDGA
jgi:Peptidase family M48